MALPGYNVVVSIATASSGESFSVLDGAINFQIRDFRETLDATDFESGSYRQRVMGLRDVSAQVSGQLEPSDVGYQKLKAAYEAGQPIGFKVLFSSTVGLTLEMLVKSFEWSGSVDGTVDLSVQMVGSGGAGPIETAPTTPPVEYVGVGAPLLVDGSVTPAPQTVAVPPAQAGDLLLLLVAARNSTTTLSTPPPGWTYHDNITRVAVFWKISDGTETVATVNYTTFVGGVTIIAQAAAFRNTHPTAPIAQVGSTANGTTSTAMGPIPGISVSPNNAVIVVGHLTNDWTSVDTLSGDGLAWEEIDEPDTTLGSDAGLVWDYAINTTGGVLALTDKTFSIVAPSSGGWLGFMFEIANAPV